MKQRLSLLLCLLLLTGCTPSVTPPPVDDMTGPAAETTSSAEGSSSPATPDSTEPKKADTDSCEPFVPTPDTNQCIPVVTPMEALASAPAAEELGNFLQYVEVANTNGPITIPKIVTEARGMIYTPGYCTAFSVEEGHPTFTAIDGVLYSADLTKLIAYPAASDRTSFTVPDSVETIGGGAFCGCRNLTEIVFPDTLKAIGQYAFGYCTSLKEVTLPRSLTTLGLTAFKDCDALKEVTIPASVKGIGEAAFYCCDSLQKVVIEEGVTAIGHNAFSDCPKLTDVTIPKTVTDIGGYTFRSPTFYDTPWLDGQTDDFVIVGDGVLLAYNGGSKTPVLPQTVKTIAGGLAWPEDLVSLTMTQAQHEAAKAVAYALPDDLKVIVQG